MQLTDPQHDFRLLSVVELHLSPQDTEILPRAHSVLSFRVTGCASIDFENQHFQLGNDSILFVPADRSYHISSDCETVICINLSISGFKDIPPNCFTPRNVPVFKEAFVSIYEEWSMKKPGYYQKCMSILYTILHHLERQFSPVYSSAAFHSISPAVNHMHAKFTDAELSIALLSQICNLSDTQFRKNFYKVYNTTPLKYLQILRINYAADLLANSNLSIEDISTMSGFTDSKYFCSVFKKYKHHAPSTFRKSI